VGIELSAVFGQAGEKKGKGVLKRLFRFRARIFRRGGRKREGGRRGAFDIENGKEEEKGVGSPLASTLLGGEKVENPWRSPSR